MMTWEGHLGPAEVLRWEGRPAPRCFTFRNWLHSLFGFLLLFLASYWQMVGYQLSQAHHSLILALVPLPFLLAGIYLSFGHLLLARWEWENVFYAVTDRRILARRGLFRPRVEELPLAEVTGFRLKPLGENLGTLRIQGSGDPPASLVLHCIEYPGQVTELFEEAVGNFVIHEP
ncbi:MAG: PH domain-containing protein [Desulfuromonadales bacterium]|jgi:hypothetical protein